jgi:tetratricopeptide (TPR) repeat protein
VFAESFENGGGAWPRDTVEDRKGDGALKVHFPLRTPGARPLSLLYGAAVLTSAHGLTGLVAAYKIRSKTRGDFRPGARHRRGTSVAPATVLRCYSGPTFHAPTDPRFSRCPHRIAVPGVARADDRAKSKEQVEFGIRVAQNGLWNEALYWWQKAVKLDPTYAAAWNNLAIAYEHEGKFDEAKKAYEKALELDPKNLMIRQNFDLFKEINDRTKRRSGK